MLRLLGTFSKAGQTGMCERYNRVLLTQSGRALECFWTNTRWM